MIHINAVGAEGLGSIIGAAHNLSFSHFLVITEILIGAGLTTSDEVIESLRQQINWPRAYEIDAPDYVAMIEHSIKLMQDKYGPCLVAVDGGKED